MKKILTLTMILCSTLAFSQIEGTWKLADQGAALGVGPNQGDISWWSNSLPDVTTRACLFDDSITFEAGGNMIHYMDGDTWVETWQGAATEGCGVPVAPHDGTPATPYTYTFDGTTGALTVNGLGAHLGLAKVHNGGELISPTNAVSTITYEVAFSNNDNTMTVDINFTTGWWRFIYDRTSAPVVIDPTVTFSVDMSQYTTAIATAVNLSGEFNGWCGDCAPMTDMGSGIWELAVQLPAGEYQYKFSVDNWTDSETLTAGDPCVDTIADGFENRILTVTVDETLPVVCYGSCEDCSAGIDDLSAVQLFQVVPNPANNQVVVNFEGNSKDIAIMDLSGRVVKVVNDYVSGSIIDVSDFDSGAFVITSNSEEGRFSTVLIIE